MERKRCLINGMSMCVFHEVPNKKRFLIQISGTSAIYTHETIDALFNSHLYIIMYKFRNKMILQAHFNRAFLRKHPCQRWDLNPRPSDSHLLDQGIAFLTRICISPIDHFAPIGINHSGDLAAVTITTASVTGIITQSLCIL